MSGPVGALTAAVPLNGRGATGATCFIGSCLTALARLGALRDPEGLPPFAQLEALRGLVTERHLRPVEITILYRLAGPPKRLRWTYQLVPELTDSEREAISRIEPLRASARYVRYRVYEPDAP